MKLKIKRLVRFAEEIERKVAMAQEARSILGIPSNSGKNLA